MKSKLFLSLALFFCVLTLHVTAQDPVKVAPGAFKEKLNNDHVRVLEYHSKPGDKEAMHAHAEGVLYVVKGGKIKFTNADGTSKEVEYKDGEVLWRDAVKHSVENIGTTEVQALLVETKGMKK